MGLFGKKVDPDKSAALRQQVEAIVDPHTDETLGASGAVHRVEVRGSDAEVEIVLDYPAKSWERSLTAEIGRIVGNMDGIDDVAVTVAFVSPEGSERQGKPLPGVRNIIAVASGKGGVGKSTTSVNLALALAAEGARVGLLDADIYGPSQPRMLGATEQPKTLGDKSMLPVMAHGLQTMSIGYLIDDTQAMVWRGPMVTSALMQLLNDTRWENLDYLIVDMPPGTGDIQLTMAQKVPVAGSVIVTTPQDIALLDARKAITMFDKVNVPVLGIVENMALHVCSHCGHVESIFGQGGGERLAEEYHVDLLGSLPLDLAIREDLDQGEPTVVRQPESVIAESYRKTARTMAAVLGKRMRSGEEDAGPVIEIEED